MYFEKRQLGRVADALADVPSHEVFFTPYTSFLTAKYVCIVSLIFYKKSGYLPLSLSSVLSQFPLSRFSSTSPFSIMEETPCPI